jgi:hypothetical protein
MSWTPGDFKSDTLRGHERNSRRAIFAEWILQKELIGSGGRRPMSVRRLCDLKVNRTVAARAPGDNDFTFNNILDKLASCNYASKEVSCQTQGEGQ